MQHLTEQLSRTTPVESLDFTAITANLVWLAKLPLLIRVQTTLLMSMCHAIPFSDRALKNIFSDVDIVVKKQIEMWFIMVCTLVDNEYASLLFSQTFFHIVSACWASLQKSFNGKSNSYN